MNDLFGDDPKIDWKNLKIEFPAPDESQEVPGQFQTTVVTPLHPAPTGICSILGITHPDEEGF